MRVRPAAVAGRFYPRETGRLASDVEAYLSARPQRGPAGPDLAENVHSLVVPHAGYVYSGPTAGAGYRLLRALAGRVRRVLLLGPAHYVPVTGVAVTSADRWETPLGEAVIDTDARDAVLARGRELEARHGLVVEVDDAAHAPEHSLEVQVPFLQTALPGVPIVPLLVGSRDAEAVADLLRPWWGDEGTLLLVSTDLSHYEPDEVAKRLDARTAAAVCRADADAIGDRDACGARPLRAVLRLAAEAEARVHLLDLRTSADTAGDPFRVVGYGAFAVGS